MPIRSKGNKFQVDIRRKGIVFRQSCDTYQQASELHKVCLRCIEDGAPLPSVNQVVGITLDELFKRTAKKYWSNTDWGLTQISRSERVLKILDGNTLVRDVTSDMIENLMDELKAKGNSDSTMNHTNAVLSKAFNLALDKGWIAKKPKLDWKRSKNGRIRYVIPEEEAIMFEYLTHANQLECRDLFMFLIDTGLRRGEALNLRTRDVDMDKGSLTVWESKNGEARTVPLTHRVKAIMSSRISPKSRLENNHVFDLNITRITRVWRRMKSHMGLDNDSDFVLHTLRHTCASRLVQKGIQIQVVQRWLGHKTIAMTLRYAHLNTSNLMDAVSALESGDISSDMVTI